MALDAEDVSSQRKEETCPREHRGRGIRNESNTISNPNRNNSSMHIHLRLLIIP
jgi:hypothetical protein